MVAQAGGQRHHDQRCDLAPAPERDARPARRLGAGLHPGRCRAHRRRSAPASPQTTSGSSDARRLRAGAAARASAASARLRKVSAGTVDHDTDKHDRRHDEGALGRDLRAGQQQVEERREQRRKRRPFLDRVAHREQRDERKQRAHREEHDARDHRHVIAGDRQHMARGSRCTSRRSPALRSRRACR